MNSSPLPISSSEGPTGNVELDPRMVEEMRSIAKKDLYFFSKGVLGYDWFHKDIHMPVCRLLEDMSRPELLIVLPRGFQKTTLCTICYPIWRAINNPEIRILLAQNTATNADAKLNVIRSIFEGNQIFRKLFPELLPTKSCVWKTGSLCVPRTRTPPESTFESTGMGAGIVGRHYDEVIEDDTVAPDADDMDQKFAIPTKDAIEKAIGFHNSLASIVDNTLVRNSVVVGTRWAEDDLIEHIEKTMGSDVSVLQRAAKENEKGEPDVKGRPTFPSRFPEEVLRKLEKRWGPYMYSCLYQNKPIRSEDMIFKPEWIRYYETEPAQLDKYTTVDLANDPTNLQSSDPDYTVVLTAGKDPRTGRIFILEVTRERCDPGRQVELVFQHHQRWNPRTVGIPKVAYEQSLDYWLKEEMRRRGVFFPVTLLGYGTRSKELRIQGLQPVFSSASVFVRTHQNDLVEELLKFPNGSHDDVIDALSMQLGLWDLTVGAPKELFLLPDPLDFRAAAEELRKHRQLKDGHFSDLLKEDFLGNGLDLLQFLN